MLFPYHDDNPTTRAPLVTVALIAINAATFLYVLQLEPLAQRIIHAEHGFVPARMKQLRDPDFQVQVKLGQQIVPFRVGPNIAEQTIVHVHRLPPDRNQILSTLVTAMFLHGGWLHLLGNMWFLWLFGNNIEDQLGHVLFVLLYFAGGMFAWVAHGWMMSGEQALQPAIGASGAVAAVLGAYALRFPHARVRCVIFIIIFFTIVELPAMFVLGIWFIGQLFDAFADQHRISGGVAWWAHVGGFAAGLVLMPLLSRLAPKSEAAGGRFRISDL